MTLWVSLLLFGLPLAYAVRVYGRTDARRARLLGRAGAAVLLSLFILGVALQWTPFDCGAALGWSNHPWIAKAQVGLAFLLLTRFMMTSMRLRGPVADTVEASVAYPVSLKTDLRSPAAWTGWGTARIFFPKALWRELAPGARDLVLFHEEAHLRGHDLWWRWALTAGLWLSLGNPAFWVLRRELARVDEFNADDAALAQTRAPRAELVRLFLKIAEPVPAHVAGFPGELRARAERLLQPTPRTRRPFMALVFLVWGFAAVTASAYEARLVSAEFGPEGIALHRTEIRFGILNPLLESDFSKTQPQCRRNP